MGMPRAGRRTRTEDARRNGQDGVSLQDAAAKAGVSPATLRRWTREGLIPHCGDALYRDGDYYGRDVNIASRVAARSAGGEVLVTRPVVERAGPHLEFERIAEVRLKGCSESAEVFLARQSGEEEE
jgi:class 3 adenylate cyclase